MRTAKVRTAKDVLQYLEGVDYPAGPPELHVAATRNGAPPGFVELLGLLPTTIVFYGPAEVAAQLERVKGLGKRLVHERVVNPSVGKEG
jgi:Protein of unknown function (DUF2795)